MKIANNSVSERLFTPWVNSFSRRPKCSVGWRLLIVIPLWRGLWFDRRYSYQKRNFMQDFSDKKIILGLCGGIAAYKSAYLVRELKRLGARIRVVMTESAQQFISPLTLQALGAEEVRIDL